MLLNHDYSDMRGCENFDLGEALRDEAEYLARAELLERDSAEMVDLLDEIHENGDGGVDLG